MQVVPAGVDMPGASGIAAQWLAAEKPAAGLVDSQLVATEPAMPAVAVIAAPLPLLPPRPLSGASRSRVPGPGRGYPVQEESPRTEARASVCARLRGPGGYSRAWNQRLWKR